MEQMYAQTGEFTPDNLIASQEFPIAVEGVSLKSGQGVVKRGTVLGIITASGLAVAVNSTATDGSQTPFCIATDSVDTTNGDVQSTGYTAGMFNSAALIFGGTDTVDTHKVKLRELNILVKERLAY